MSDLKTREKYFCGDLAADEIERLTAELENEIESHKMTLNREDIADARNKVLERGLKEISEDHSADTWAADLATNTLQEAIATADKEST